MIADINDRCAVCGFKPDWLDDTVSVPMEQCRCDQWFCPACIITHECEYQVSGDVYDVPDSQPVANGGLVPRPYQADGIEKSIAQLAEVESTLVVWPTGGGKTILIGHVCNDYGSLRKMVIGHRDELIRQNADKISRVTGEPCEIEMGLERSNEDLSHNNRARVVCASVQTMCKAKRQQRFNPNDFDLLVFDEAHHATASTYRQVAEYFRQNRDLRILGVTATPDRADEEALGQIFKSVAHEYPLPEAIKDGWLVPIQQQYVEVDGLDYSQIRTTAGDLNQADLAAVMTAESILHKVVDPTLSIAGDRKTLIFAASVAHAERMAEIINRHKPESAYFVHGKTDKERRREMLRRYDHGDFQFLVNCMIATEGFDVPSIECVAIARPTKSRSLYSQMIGRSTRPLTGCVDRFGSSQERVSAIASSAKPHALILDFVGNSGRHKLVTVKDILGGNYSDQIVEMAEADIAAAGKRGEATDVQQAFARAADRAERLKAEQRKQIVAKAKFTTRFVNPFDVFDMVPAREPGWHRGRRPTDTMKFCLRNAGVDNATIEKASFTTAGQMIAKIKERRNQGLCTFKQARVLANNGYDTDCTFEQASEIITKLAVNWKKR